jgi:hypothetical protein
MGRPRLDDRRVLNAIFFVLRTGTPWRDLPERYGPHTTAYNRLRPFRRPAVELRQGKVRRSLVQDLIGLAQLAILPLQRLDGIPLPGCGPSPPAAVTLGLPHPTPQRLAALRVSPRGSPRSRSSLRSS